MESQKIDLTQSVADDINHIMGEAYSLAQFVGDVGNCFSTVDYEDPACQDCIVQAACSIYRGEKRLGLVGLRALTPDRSMKAPSEVKALLLTALMRPQTVVGLPQPPSPLPPPPPVSKPSAALPTLPGTIYPVGTSVKQAPPPPEAPNPGLAAGLIPADGSPPLGWPGLDRESLAKICLELGYDKKTEVNFRKEKKLIEMIVAKRPQWKPTNGAAVETVQEEEPFNGQLVDMPENVKPKKPVTRVTLSKETRDRKSVV